MMVPMRKERTFLAWCADQILFVRAMIFRPHAGLVALPANRPVFSGAVVFSWICFPYILNPDEILAIQQWLPEISVRWAFIGILCLSLYLLAGAIFYGGLRIIGARLTFWLALNLLGLGLSPLLLIKIPISLILALMREPHKLAYLSGEYAFLNQIETMAFWILSIYAGYIYLTGIVAFCSSEPRKKGGER